MIKIDLHNHTSHSHGQSSVEEMYNAAKENGLEIMGFSEHSPRPAAYSYPTEYRDHLAATFEQYIQSVQALKQLPDGPKVLLGLEMDYFPSEESFIRETISKYDYDYIIGGLHFLGTWGFDHSREDWQPLSEDEKCAFYAEYYETLIKMAQSGLMNIAAHPDLIKLFSIDTFREWVQESSAKNLIRRAIAAIMENNMAMEISSAGLRKPCKEIYPGPAVMEIAAELNVPITFASDAHHFGHVAHAFDRLAAYAADYGYTESVYYCNRSWRKISFQP
ncbi:MAG: histidinol-phosphatase [Desulfovibrionaceae bacterium]|nr:histidinol-phosphatase [Desulfovibrionaceae bacterium]